MERPPKVRQDETPKDARLADLRLAEKIAFENGYCEGASDVMTRICMSVACAVLVMAVVKGFDDGSK